jgi:hypothetical protein
MGLFDLFKSDIPGPMYRHGKPGDPDSYLSPLPSATDPSIHKGNSRKAIRLRAEEKRKAEEWIAMKEKMYKKYNPGGPDRPIGFVQVSGAVNGNSMEPPPASRHSRRGMQPEYRGRRTWHRTGEENYFGVPGAFPEDGDERLSQGNFGLADPAMLGGGRGSAAHGSTSFGRGAPMGSSRGRGHFGDLGGMGGMGGGRRGMSSERDRRHFGDLGGTDGMGNGRGGMSGFGGSFGGRGQ